MNTHELVDAYKSIMEEIRVRERTPGARHLQWDLYNGMQITDVDKKVEDETLGDDTSVLSDDELTTPECRDIMQFRNIEKKGQTEGVVPLVIIGGGPAGLS